MSYQLELRHFKYFLAVADELHYRRAAEKLFISQPGLSRQIKQMEEILDTQLFVRNKKKVELTVAGQYLKGEIEFIINHLEMTTKQLKRIDQGEHGEVRIGFLGSAMQNVIPKLLVKLKDRFPKIKTSLDELSNNAQVSSLLKDKLDLGFVRLSRVPEPLESKVVYEDTFSVVLPESFPILTRNFTGVEILREKDFILFSQEYSPLYYDTIMSICEDAGFTPKISHKSVHAHTIFKLVENNLGIAIVPTSLQSGFLMRVKFIELKNIPQRAILSAVWKKDNRNPALQNCLDLLLNK
ncbi:DNA-binding transcriptional LysR family regulator [Saonia flava]|uniref:DNA-binding transcriptional LysR family regulator n=1 Tax=Saonia flava TaxID=523696 RepID=A0A846QPU0_9FLAO|nr:LysR family transcriptional regulator [Saonia flava]NJB71066.1 DNA-binding transcriptional LysR family regulator [Saonia flava]